MKYKAVLFDMDGTTSDTIQGLTDAANYVLKKHGYEEISTDFGKTILGYGAKFFISHALPKGADVDVVLDEYLPYYNLHCVDSAKPFEGIIELLEKLRANGVKTAIISNKPDEATKQISKKEFGDLVEFAVGESASIKKKPDPSAVNAAINEFMLDKEECVYIGDTEVDIETAKNAGIDCIAVLWGFRTKEQLIKAGAEVFASNCEDLYNLLT